MASALHSREAQKLKNSIVRRNLSVLLTFVNVKNCLCQGWHCNCVGDVFLTTLSHTVRECRFILSLLCLNEVKNTVL